MRLTELLAVLGVVIGGALVAPGRAVANPYEAFIDVETEEDLADLLASQQISDDTFEALLDVLLRGVNLDIANREELYSLPNLTYDDVDAILAYRAEQGFIRDPAELVTAQVISDDKLLAIAAFLVVRDPFAGRSAVHGFVQVQSRFTIGDTIVPPLGLRARLLVGRDLTVGVAATMTRLRVGDVVYDPNREALLVDEPGPAPHVPKAYVSYSTDDHAAILGTYRIGFGQRLTFDNSSDYAPNGIYRDDQLSRSDSLSRECNRSTGELGGSPCTDDYHYITPDFKWSEPLLGVAAGVKHLSLGDGWLQAFGWASYAPRSIYQYEIYDAARCEDPRLDDSDECKAPPVLVRSDGDPLAPSPALAYATLPSMYVESLAGGNATYFLDTRNYVGVTAYAAQTDWLVDDGVDGAGDGLALDFQEWASRPSGGSFGAIGINTSIGRRFFDLGAEITHSFDAMEVADDPVTGDPRPAQGGGGPGVLVRTTFTEHKKQELEVSARYYDTDFVNPYGRPIAASDEFEGQRARDEVGGRARYTGYHGSVTVRSGLDLWQRLSDDTATPYDEGVTKGEIYVRADVKASRAIRWGVTVEYNDRDLAEAGRDECYDQAFTPEEADEPVDCQGARLSSIARVRWAADKRVTLSAQLQHEIMDDGDPNDTAVGDPRRHDVSGWVTAMWKASDDLRLRARVRYLSEDLFDGCSGPELGDDDCTDPKLEESLWTYIDATIRLRAKDRLRLRSDLYIWLDERDRTVQRTPSPELWLWAQYEAKF